jgi:hypothetical protein
MGRTVTNLRGLLCFAILFKGVDQIRGNIVKVTLKWHDVYLR